MKKNSVKSNPLVIFLMGPTASGKTSIAIALKKKKYTLDIISVDSALVYRDMNIGTAKPIFEELEIAPHKLIDIRDPSECYSVADFYYDANREIEKIISIGHVPLLVGGTMLYFKILLQGLFSLPKASIKIRQDICCEAQKIGWNNIYNKLKCVDPISANIIHLNDHKRIIRALEVFLISGKTWTEWKSVSNHLLTYRICQFAIMPTNREILNKRIEERFYKMLEIGFENEVSMLFARPELHRLMKLSTFCVGYRQMWDYLSGHIDYNHMVATAIYATRQLAKRQLTWLRKWSNVHWVYGDDVSAIADDILKILNKDLFEC